VPTEANLRGDLSDWPREIFDPFSTRQDPSKPGAFIRDPFPNNQIPASRIDPGYLAYARATLPAPIQTGVADRNQHNLTPVRQDEPGEYTARIDHNFGEKDMIWARGSGSIFNQDGSGGRQTLLNYSDTNSLNVGASWVHRFNPTSILQVQFARTVVERDEGTTFLDLPANFMSEVGFDPEFVHFRSGSDLVPNIAVSQFFSGGESNLYARPSELWQYKANYAKIFGNHQFKLGGEFNKIAYRRIINDHNVNFDPAETSDPRNPGKTGSALASFLLNVPNNAGRRDFNKTTRFGGVFGFYFQDSWKVTPKLTANLGLRYDYTKVPPLGNKQNGTIYMGNFDLMQGVYILQAVPGPCDVVGEAPCIPTPDGSLPDHVIVDPRQKLMDDYTDNWQPRIGFAYRLTERTALRSSFGMFFDNWAGMMQIAQNLGHTWPDIGRRLSSNLNNPTPAQPVPAVSGKNPFPQASRPEPDPFGSGAHFQDPHTRDAYSMQWNFGVQHQLTGDALVSINYVGSGNRRLPLGGFYNVALTPGPGNRASRQPFPYIAPTNWHRSWSRSSYNGLQFQLKNRSSRGLSYTVNYTWSKSIDIGCSGFFNAEGCAVQDPYNFNNDRSVAGADLPHILNVSWVYELPVGKGKALQSGNSIVDQIIGNWQVNGIAMFRSGQAYTVNVNGDIANTGNSNGYMRPNVVGNPVLSNPTPERWINTDAFAVPAPFTFGNAGRNILRADGRANFDLSIFRHFRLPFREGARLEFRVESFNAFNSTQFNAPTSNLSNSNFGKVLSAEGERQFQIGMKLLF
jgi:hypothetical protein